jgi:hypothetical protein
MQDGHESPAIGVISSRRGFHLAATVQLPACVGGCSKTTAAACCCCGIQKWGQPRTSSGCMCCGLVQFREGEEQSAMIMAVWRCREGYLFASANGWARSQQLSMLGAMRLRPLCVC